MTRVKNKPRLTRWVTEYAMAQARRLKKSYPLGMTSNDLATELNTAPHTACATMNNYGYHQFDRRFAVEDVAALLAYRQYRKMKKYLEGLV